MLKKTCLYNNRRPKIKSLLLSISAPVSEHSHRQIHVDQI